jgi:Lrp/AsnC family transcriptional regulator for asnA, asnC and gidA
MADGVMEITAVTNPLKLGFDVVCLLGLNVDPRDREAAGEALAALDEVTYLIACTGRYDYLVEVVCNDNKHLLEFMQVKLAAVPGISGTESFGYLSVLKESYRTTPGGDD